MNYLSLFSGMEAAHLAWSPLGWRCKGVAEIDPAACCLLANRLNASRPKYMPDPMADGPRYKMLGNSFAVPVIHWIGESIQRAHTWAQQELAA
ncbi:MULTISPECIES: hypothetical protein [Xanthomonas]|uniref:hypothetical protein n=1 Tax=Xanthomonas TaxID=338 RepID=UPI001C2BE49F|nr:MULTISPECIES: hypothetical protein [Xanthomonas]QXF03565.1 hypothetical protein KJA71_08955 [Xanthomonas citri pv. citri]QXO96817.1 hypothetical protein IG630_24005 [Xanthomonas sp. WG16]